MPATPAATATVAPSSKAEDDNAAAGPEEATPDKQPPQPQQQKKKGATPPPLQVEGLGQIEAVALSPDGALAAAVYRHKVRGLWGVWVGVCMEVDQISE